MIGPLLTEGIQKTIFHRIYESLLIWAIIILQTQTSCHFPGMYYLQQIAASMKGAVGGRRGGGRSYCRLSLLETHLNLKKMSLTRPFFVIIIVLLSSFALLLHMKESKQTQLSVLQIVKIQTELLQGKPKFWWSFIQTNLSEVLTSFDGWGLKVIGRRW